MLELQYVQKGVQEGILWPREGDDRLIFKYYHPSLFYNFLLAFDKLCGENVVACRRERKSKKKKLCISFSRSFLSLATIAHSLVVILTGE